MKISFLLHANKTYIHMNSFALDLGLKRRLRATRKWAIRFGSLPKCMTARVWEKTEPHSNSACVAGVRRGKRRGRLQTRVSFAFSRVPISLLLRTPATQATQQLVSGFHGLKLEVLHFWSAGPPGVLKQFERHYLVNG